MSRVQLEWKIESRPVDLTDSDDPKAIRSRRRAILWLASLILLLLLLALGAAFALRQRAMQRQIDLENLLRDTVKAEAASLRIGDINTWLGIQDGRDPGWRLRQQATFRQYSEMKARGDIQLPGTIHELRIEGQVARVVVEEIISGRASMQTWYYAFDGGAWRHIAPSD